MTIQFFKNSMKGTTALPYKHNMDAYTKKQKHLANSIKITAVLNNVYTARVVVQRVERWTSRVQILLEATLCNNLGQVVYTYVPLSPSSITWYQPKGGDALRLGR